MVSLASSYAAVNTACLSLVWTLRKNSCAIFKTRGFVLLFGMIFCDIPLDQLGLKIESGNYVLK